MVTLPVCLSVCLSATLRTFKSFQVLPSPFKSIHDLSSHFKSFQVLSSPSKSFQVLPSPFKSFKDLPCPLLIFPVFPSPSKSFQVLPNPSCTFISFQVFPSPSKSLHIIWKQSWMNDAVRHFWWHHWTADKILPHYDVRPTSKSWKFTILELGWPFLWALILNRFGSHLNVVEFCHNFKMYTLIQH